MQLVDDKELKFTESAKKEGFIFWHGSSEVSVKLNVGTYFSG